MTTELALGVVSALLLVSVAALVALLMLLARRRDRDRAQESERARRLAAERERAAEAESAQRAALAADREQLDGELATGREQAVAEHARLDAQARGRARQVVVAAEEEARRVLVEAETERRQGQEKLHAARDEMRHLMAAHDRREQRIAAREDRTEAERAAVATDRAGLASRRDDVEARSVALAAAEEAQRHELGRIAGLPVAEARAELLARLEHEARLAAVATVRDIERTAQREGEERARHLLVGAMQRVASDQTAESTVAAVDLPSEDMKGRIIGREGRNIRAFEQVTGVNLMIDDTPGLVLLSCFDPVRREIARRTLIELVQDGRIHPTRIEAAHERASVQIHDLILRAAEDALAQMRITDLDPGLHATLGALTFRTSYGQNVLKHLLECGHLAALIAAELGLDIAFCRRAAFLHDIGKALTHEVEGSHALVGAELLRRHGEHEDIVHAVAAHHNEVEPATVEAVLVQVCDAISGSRPAARRESLESYVHRLERLEEIGLAHPGVDRVFAMQAGRDIRVMVRPEDVDDDAAAVLAREVAGEIERELTYPGQIRVTVVRESRATEIAH